MPLLISKITPQSPSKDEYSECDISDESLSDSGSEESVKHEESYEGDSDDEDRGVSVGEYTEDTFEFE